MFFSHWYAIVDDIDAKDAANYILPLAHYWFFITHYHIIYHIAMMSHTIAVPTLRFHAAIIRHIMIPHSATLLPHIIIHAEIPIYADTNTTSFFGFIRLSHIIHRHTIATPRMTYHTILSFRFLLHFHHHHHWGSPRHCRQVALAAEQANLLAGAPSSRSH